MKVTKLAIIILRQKHGRQAIKNKTQSIGSSTILSVVFPSQASLKTFTINIYAETVENIRTKHKPRIEVRNEDNSINLNKSTGSNSDIVTKLLYQDVVKNLYLSCIAPELYVASTDVVNGATSGTNRIVIDGSVSNTSIVRVGDKVTETGIAAGLHALVTKIDPDGDNDNEIEISIADSVTNDAAITFTPPFNGMIPHYTDSTSGRAAIEVTSLSISSFPFSITVAALAGRAFSLKRKPTAEDLCFVKLVTFGSAALALEGEDTSSSTYYRWPITNIADVVNGMALDPARRSTGTNTTTPAFISGYNTTKTIQQIDDSNRYYTDFIDKTVGDFTVNGVDSYGNDITAVDRNGRITAQAGNITFSTQQADALKSDANVRLIAQGTNAIEKATGMSVALSSVTVVGADQDAGDAFSVSTTTTGASSSSTTIAVTEAKDIVVGSVIRSIDIRSNVAPTVVSKSAATGGANIVASSAVTLASGATVHFDGVNNAFRIAGIINIKNMPISDTTLYFNVERFLTCL